MDIHINRAHNNSALPTMPETYAFKLEKTKDIFLFTKKKCMQLQLHTASVCTGWTANNAVA